MEKVSGRAQKAEGQAERGRDDSAIGQRLKVVCVPSSRSRSSSSTTGQISTGNGVTDRDGVGGDGAVRCCRASQRSAPPCSAICRPFPRAPGRLLLSSWARATKARKVLSDWMVHGSPAALVSAGVPSCEQQLAWLFTEAVSYLLLKSGTRARRLRSCCSLLLDFCTRSAAATGLLLLLLFLLLGAH